jgi:hypothetical protein
MSSASLMQVDQSEPDEVSKEIWFDLQLNRDLLDSKFEGYKLSLDSFVHYKLDMSLNGLTLNTYNFVESSSSTQQKFFLYQHLKLFGMQNLLVYVFREIKFTLLPNVTRFSLPGL